jgi:SAM-dependent methyltransferase
VNDLILADAAAGLPLKAAQFDLVCAFDLLEHLPEERPLLREIRRVLKANGFLFLTVPAFGFLWSEHDEALGHQRRYTAVDLRALLGESGFRIVRLSYYNSFLFPIAYLYRLIRRIFRSFPRRVLSRGACSPQSDFFVRLPTSANQILYSCFKSEALFLRYLNLPLGLALIGVASPRE